MKNTNVTIRLDDELKAQAETLFAELGMSLSTAINVFLRQAVREQGIPFSVSLRTESAKAPAEEEVDEPNPFAMDDSNYYGQFGNLSNLFGAMDNFGAMEGME